MTLTAGIDSYADRVEADAYFAARGVAAWAAADAAARDAALLRATAWIEGRYRWAGRLVDLAQPLAWPRTGACDDEGRPLDGIPHRVKAACAELALVALSEDLAPPLDRGGRVLAERVGQIEVDYAPDAPSGRSFPAVEALLRGLLRGGVATAVRRA